MNEIIRCLVCGTLFDARPQAKYCSDKCRQQANRQKKKPKGDDFETARKLVGNLSNNKKRSIVVMIMESLEDSDRVKVYSSLIEDFYRLNKP